MLTNMKCLAAGSVLFTAGAPSWAWQNGAFSATITDTGTGNIGINLPADGGVDSLESVILCTPRATLAASGLVAIAVSHTSDVVKQVTILQEQAAGAASALADVAFDIAIFVKSPV